MWNNQGGQSTGQGAGGGFGDQGGGYMNSPAGGSFDSPQGGSQSERKNRQQRAQNSLPCTVSQIMSATHDGDKFLMDNIELHQVTIVGLVRTVTEASTRLDYTVDDMTAPPMEVRQFVDNDDNTPDEERTPAMRENTYVRVHGHVRAFGGKRNLVAFKIIPLMDMNELATHMLEVVHSHMYLTKAQNNAPGNTSMAGENPGYMPQAGGGGANTGDYAGAQPDQGLTHLQNQVHDVIRSVTDDQGVGVPFIVGKLRGIPAPAIKEALDFLSGEGHIYSTIDDEHFRSTDSM